MSDAVDPERSVDELERSGALDRAAAAARAVAQSTGDQAERARLFVRAAELVSRVEGTRGAAPLLEEAVRAAKAARRPDIEAAALAEIALLELAARDPAALRRAERSLARARRLTGNAEALSRIDHYAGLLAARRGRPAAAIAALRRAYEAADGDPAQRARVLNTWGLHLEAWGDPDEARRMLERSLEIKLQLEDHWGAAATWGTLAFLHARLGDHAAARDALARDLDICERIGSRDALPGLHARLAAALLGLGRIAGAEREAARALDLAEGSSSPACARAAGFAWRETARVRLAQRRPDEAIDAARDRALAAFERLGEPYGAALARITIAEIEIERAAAGDGNAAARAAEALGRATPVLAGLGAVHDLAEALLLSARAAMLRGEPRAAARLVLDRALPLIDRFAGGARRLRRAALETLAAADPRAAAERLDVEAGLRRCGTSVAADDGGAAPAAVVAALVPDDEAAAKVARAAASEGAVLVWFPPTRAVAVLRGDDAATAAAALVRRLRGFTTAVASGLVELVAPWPAGPLARGPAVVAALRMLGRRHGAPGAPARPKRRSRP